MSFLKIIKRKPLIFKFLYKIDQEMNFCIEMLKINVVIISTISMKTQDVVSTSIKRLYGVLTSYRRVIGVETTSCAYVVRFNFDCINFYQVNRQLFNPLISGAPFL